MLMGQFCWGLCTQSRKIMQWLHPTMQTKNMYCNVNKGVDDKFFFKKNLNSFFKDYVLSGIFQTNHHKWSWITYYTKSPKTSNSLWFKHDNLTFAYSHVVQPFDVSCFKSFKTAFKKKRMRLWLEANTMNQTKLHLLARWIEPWTNPWHHKTLGMVLMLLEYGHLTL